MKKILNITFLFLLMISFKNVSALEDDAIIINNNNIEITEERFFELMDAGYTMEQIYNMDLDTDTNNEDIAVSTKYLKTVTTTRYGNTTSETVEVTEEEYLNNDGGNISFYASGTSETTYKRLTATITTSESNSNRKFYRAYMYWKTMPATRSNDIIGLGFDSTVVELNLSPNFYQLYTYGGYTYTSQSAYVTEFPNGAGAVFQLPTNSSLKTLCQEINFDVIKKNSSNTITRLETAGDYAHAIEEVNGSTANNNYNANTAGLSLYSAINSKYDSMSSATVLWTGTW